MAFEIKMDFYRDWIFHLREELTQAGYNPAAELEKVSLQYFNLLQRLVPAVPRKILIAKEFTCPSELQLGLDLVKMKIEKGIDLRPHLSRKIADLDYDDDLLNDWDIHHLHLGTTLDGDGFVQRTGPVLFVRFDKLNAFFINVMEHGNWANIDMIRIIHRNWPESIEHFRMKGIAGLSKTVTDNDIKAFRKGHVVSFIELEPGVIYAPPGMGLTTAGIGINVVQTSNYYADLMKQYEIVIKENIDVIIEKIKAEKTNIGKELSFKLKIEGKNVRAYEEKYEVIVDLGELP